jgi:hypothetical protein
MHHLHTVKQVVAGDEVEPTSSSRPAGGHHTDQQP